MSSSRNALHALLLATCGCGPGPGDTTDTGGVGSTNSTGQLQPTTGDVNASTTVGPNDIPAIDRKRVFYFRNGSLGKILDSADTRLAVEAADEDCTNGAAEMGWGGMWRAWLSTSQVDAIDRIEDVGPWYRVDQETLLFASKAELTTGPRAPIDLTLDDPNREDDELFWSGTDLDGRRTVDNCEDWTIYNVPAVAAVGRADIAGAAWVAAELLLCSNYLALLCIEQ